MASTASTNTSPAQAPGRVVFVDQARALAIAMMIFGHSMDRFLGEPWRSGQAWQDYQFFRGITSALFLLVSGFSFVIASFKYWDDYTHPSPRLWARARRIGLILLLGYTLQLWAPTLTQSIALFSTERWEKLVHFDVLQNIGCGLIILHVITLAVRTPQRFWIATLVLVLAVLALAPLTYHPAVDQALPLELATTVNLYHGSRFPLIPHISFLLLGAVFGHLYWNCRKRGEEWKALALAAGTAVFLIGLDLALTRVELFPYSTAQKNTPGHTAARAGCALLVVSGFYLLGRYKIILGRLSFLLSKDALAIYFFHLLLVYGNGITGCFPSLAQKMTPLQVSSWIATLFAAMVAMAAAFAWLRRARPTLLRISRHIAISTSAICFVALQELSFSGIAAALATSTAVILLVERYLVGPGQKRGKEAVLGNPVLDLHSHPGQAG